MEPVKADIIEYISGNGEKYSLNISEMISTEMIAKINSGKEKLTEEESFLFNKMHKDGLRFNDSISFLTLFLIISATSLPNKNINFLLYFP